MGGWRAKVRAEGLTGPRPATGLAAPVGVDARLRVAPWTDSLALNRSLSKLSDAVRTESAAYAATVGRASRQDLDRFTLSLSSCVLTLKPYH